MFTGFTLAWLVSRHKAKRIPPLVWRIALVTLLLVGLLLALGLYQRHAADDPTLTAEEAIHDYDG